MTPSFAGRAACTILGLVAGSVFAAACAPATRAASTGAAPAGGATARASSAPSGGVRYQHTAADVQFMTAMIAHHAQAVQMSSWAATHDAGPSVRTLAERIINGQQDEIVTMQQWLRDRGLPVPDAKPVSMSGGSHAAHGAHGAPHAGHMPGMLSDAQLQELDRARGREFDRLFLTYMIQHHRGAVRMVEQLVGTSGAAQDQTVFKFASDVNVDQSTEIARMQKMLVTITLQDPRP